MIKKLKQLVTVFALSFSLLTPVAAVGVVGAQESIQGSLCAGTELSEPGSQSNCEAGGNASGVQDAVVTVVDLLSWIVGIVSVIMIIVGGFRYITSGGASDKVTGAKNTIIYAVIGLVIVALAQFIVNFVIGQAVNITS